MHTALSIRPEKNPTTVPAKPDEANESIHISASSMRMDSWIKRAGSINFVIAAACLLPSPILAQDRYTFSVDGAEVTDSQTGLIWNRCSDGQIWNGNICTGTASTYTFETALQRASAYATSTGLPWRLPSVKELSSIVDRSLSNPAIDAIVFPSTLPTGYYSSSPASQGGDVWYVNFYDGTVNSYISSYLWYLRLVR